ncbi:hypothetical protein B0T25DRAFT_628876 [Lasiosphaeria hispida]|uniref:Uncharacterized protein n=1 Tax=Lasiosphaeria hispida TaxID=260671 RepID=A0AAJ0MHU2_9PEZI|nr:hypothetical protein B0T25DRAFT_628876 [Lasiosphaeria hispida]
MLADLLTGHSDAFDGVPSPKAPLKRLGETRVVPQFDKWNYVDTEELAKQKLGTVAKESIFIKTITDNFTPFYTPLIPLLNRLRKIVFPKDKLWEREDEKLYSRMREVLWQVGEELKCGWS